MIALVFAGQKRPLPTPYKASITATCSRVVDAVNLPNIKRTII